MAEPRHGHIFITLPVQPPSSPIPHFLLTQDVTRGDIMRRKVS